MQKVSVIVPVYGDLPSLLDCIDSLIKFLDSRHTVLLVNDCGPEADEIEKSVQEKIKDHDNFRYMRNNKNIGFVKTCNKAVFEYDKTNNNILLLNSDTKVTEGFLEEMLSIMNSSKNICSVSPRSNNATICTVPITSMAQKGIEPERSYKLFNKIKDKLPRYHEVPTTHGFCMLIKRNLVEKYGLFDEVFGEGYGEENDLCMRLKKKGYISVLSNRSYVFHLEARSFTSEKKKELIKKNRKIIDKKYPEYTKLIREYIKKAAKKEASTYLLIYKLKAKFN